MKQEKTCEQYCNNEHVACNYGFLEGEANDLIMVKLSDEVERHRPSTKPILSCPSSGPNGKGVRRDIF